jgi:hypothetical protein
LFVTADPNSIVQAGRSNAQVNSLCIEDQQALKAAKEAATRAAADVLQNKGQSS